MLDFVPFVYLGIHSHHMYTIHSISTIPCIQDAFIYLFSISSTMILCKFIYLKFAVSVFIIELGGGHIISYTSSHVVLDGLYLFMSFFLALIKSFTISSSYFLKYIFIVFCPKLRSLAQSEPV